MYSSAQRQSKGHARKQARKRSRANKNTSTRSKEGPTPPPRPYRHQHAPAASPPSKQTKACGPTTKKRSLSVHTTQAQPVIETLSLPCPPSLCKRPTNKQRRARTRARVNRTNTTRGHCAGWVVCLCARGAACALNAAVHSQPLLLLCQKFRYYVLVCVGRW